MENFINIKLTDLIGKNIAGVKAQVRNPIYIDADNPAKLRVLSHLKVFTENKKEWIQLYWIKEGDDSCNFTGCTIQSNSCTIQIYKNSLINSVIQ